MGPQKGMYYMSMTDHACLKNSGNPVNVSSSMKPLTGCVPSRSTSRNRSRTACTMHSIKHNCLETAVLFAVRYQVSTAVSNSETAWEKYSRKSKNKWMVNRHPI